MLFGVSVVLNKHRTAVMLIPIDSYKNLVRCAVEKKSAMLIIPSIALSI